MTNKSTDRKLRLKNVASVDVSDDSFLYECKVNDHRYVCELDTAASDIFLSLSAARKMKLPITPGEATLILGDGTSVKTAGTATATVTVGGVCSEEQIQLLSGKDTEILILGRSWSSKHQPSLDWRDYSMIRTREDGTKVRISPKNATRENRTSIKWMSLKKMVRELKKGNCELFSALLVNTCPEPDANNLESARQVNCSS